MAGRVRREQRGPGRSSRAGSSSATATASAGGSGSVTATSTGRASQAWTAELRTRSIYRNLLMRGLAPDEAANITAFLAGIPIGDARWTLRQINELLFLREMNRTGHFTEPIETRIH
jgi:hypothetical protein